MALAIEKLCSKDFPGLDGFAADLTKHLKKEWKPTLYFPHKKEGNTWQVIMSLNTQIVKPDKRCRPNQCLPETQIKKIKQNGRKHTSPQPNDISSENTNTFNSLIKNLHTES